ncbi:DUF465 domain-containing protein [Marinicauda algicola]|uniref:DUF465 domain-containing protein n=1 Tax=Marinicauda algicola TaxID=2029849 RepID=A0A4S2H162_9PROT|nr:DUF465 domain-containing protein [Marinicauda algicola]TGY89265.1 DUF465 domain-containing protein [Marinicauda algicola]
MDGYLNDAGLRQRLEELRAQHRALDDQVRAAHECGMTDQLKLMRLKRRKLQLKDEITFLEDQLNPDIIA